MKKEKRKCAKWEFMQMPKWLKHWLKKAENEIVLFVAHTYIGAMKA